jgi:hypothetical protein
MNLRGSKSSSTLPVESIGSIIHVEGVSLLPYVVLGFINDSDDHVLGAFLSRPVATGICTVTVFVLNF